MMIQTISVHNGNSSTVSQAHNARVAAYLVQHVNQEHVIVDGYHRTIVDEPIADAVNRIFAEALEEYNARKRADTKHPGREIPDYYDYVVNNMMENKRAKASEGNKAGYEAMQPCYEVILQIGNHESVNGHSSEEKIEDGLSPEEAEEMLLEAVRRAEERFTVPAVGRDGAPILDDEGRQKSWKCIEVIGKYIHDDEKNKGIHLHLDYVPVAHNYRRGLSSQPGLTKALSEMGIVSDKIEDLAEERTRLMQEVYGIEYHDSDYIGANGKQKPKSELTKEQKLHREMASKLVPCRTAQTKFQHMLREILQEVVREHGIEVAEPTGERRNHMEHEEFTMTMAARQERINAERAREEVRKEVSRLEEKKEALISWGKETGSTGKLSKRMKKEVRDPVLGISKTKIIPADLYQELQQYISMIERLEKENKSLRKRVERAEQVLSQKSAIIAEARKQAEQIVAEANATVEERASLSGRLTEKKDIVDMRILVAHYEELEKDPAFVKAKEAAEQKLKVRIIRTGPKLS